jgi:hypothetical protein
VGAGDSVARNAAPTPAPVAAQAPEPPKAEPAAAEGSGSAAPGGEADAIAGVGAVAVDEPKPEKAASLHRGIGMKKAETKKDKAETEIATKTAPPPPDTMKKGSGGKNGDENEPNFDALLKQAGYQEQKKSNKPALAAKELSADDFKKGMSAISGKAQGCYKGTQGTANVKLTVDPSGRVKEVKVSGQFAGRPEADCVVNAVKGASFPPWDGGPQSFVYPFLLAE